MNTTCVCCGKHFEKLPDLMAHMAGSHSADEVMMAVQENEQKQPVYSTQQEDG